MLINGSHQLHMDSWPTKKQTDVTTISQDSYTLYDQWAMLLEDGGRPHKPGGGQSIPLGQLIWHMGPQPSTAFPHVQHMLELPQPLMQWWFDPTVLTWTADVALE